MMDKFMIDYDGERIELLGPVAKAVEAIAAENQRLRTALDGQYLADLINDADRYRRLAVLVEAGEWCIGHLEIIDSHGATNETFIDDKDMLDTWLDRNDVVESANDWQRAKQYNAKLTGEER
jgi:hypothetical protein